MLQELLHIIFYCLLFFFLLHEIYWVLLINMNKKENVCFTDYQGLSHCLEKKYMCSKDLLAPFCISFLS